MEKKKFADLNLSVECVIFGYHENRLKVLLLEQNPPANGQLTLGSVLASLPGDLMMMEESPDQCIQRILKEYTGCSAEYIKQVQTYSHPDRLKGLVEKDWIRTFRTSSNKRVIATAYYVLIKTNKLNPTPDSLGAIAKWIDISNVEELVIDHNQILNQAISILKEDLINHSIGLELLPEKFTLSQLQNLYEIISNEQLDKRNFRKTIKKMANLIALNEKQQGVLHKPAQLFQYKR